MIFTWHDDGTVTADSFPERETASLQLLAAADPKHFRVAWEGVSVFVLGVAYVIEAVDFADGVVSLRKVSH